MSVKASNLWQRPRRLCRTTTLQKMVRETTLSVNDLIYPMFVTEGEEQKVEIPSMNGCYRYSLDLLLKEIAEVYSLGINAIALFLESLTSMKRAGADLIVTYFAKEVALMLL